MPLNLKPRPLESVATQAVGEAQDSPSNPPSVSTVAGMVQDEPLYTWAMPSKVVLFGAKPTATQKEDDRHEIAVMPPLLPGSGCGLAHELPLYRTTLPASSSARQNAVVGHDTDTSGTKPCGTSVPPRSIPTAADQPVAP